MDSAVKQMLDGFIYAIKNYTSSLGPDNPKIQETRKICDDLIEKAEKGANVTAISMDENFTRLGKLVGELASEKPLSKEEIESYGDQISADEIPAASVPAAGYHMAWNHLDDPTKNKMKKYYDRIFEIESRARNAVFFNTMLVEDGVLLNMSREPLIEEARKTIEKAKEVFSPTVNYQQKHAIEVYGAVGTIQELEFEAAKMAEMSNVEHEWDAQYIEVIGLLPACAQAIEAHGPRNDLVTKLKNSYRFMAEFMGIGWDDVFENERYLYFWENVMWKNMPALKKIKYAVTTPKAYADVLKKKYFEPHITNEPVPRKNPQMNIRLWGQQHDVKHVLRLLNDPPRPEVMPE